MSDVVASKSRSKSRSVASRAEASTKTVRVNEAHALLATVMEQVFTHGFDCSILYLLT